MVIDANVVQLPVEGLRPALHATTDEQRPGEPEALAQSRLFGDFAAINVEGNPALRAVHDDREMLPATDGDYAAFGKRLRTHLPSAHVERDRGAGERRVERKKKIIHANVLAVEADQRL